MIHTINNADSLEHKVPSTAVGKSKELITDSAGVTLALGGGGQSAADHLNLSADSDAIVEINDVGR